MIPFRSFVTNNARRYEKGERDHNAVAGALLLASGCTEAPTAGISLRSMVERVQGLSNNAAFREGRLSLYADIEGVIEEVFASLGDQSVKKQLLAALRVRARDDASSKAYMVTGVAPKSESRENRDLRARVQELEKQLADEVQKVHQLRGVNTELRNQTRLRTEVPDVLFNQHGQIVNTPGGFVSVTDLLRDRDNLRRGWQDAVAQCQEAVARGAELLRQETERREADTKILRDENAQLRKITDRTATVTPYEERHTFTVNGVKFAPTNGGTDARDSAMRVLSDVFAQPYKQGTIEANTATAKLLKQKLGNIEGFDVSGIPDYDPSKPGAVSTAIAEAVRKFGSDRHSVGCRDSHKVVDGWLLHFLRELGCGATEIGEVAEWTRVEHHGNAPFKVAREVVLRRVMGLLKKIAQDAMPVGLPRPWGNGEVTPAAIESAAEQLVQEIKSRANEGWIKSAMNKDAELADVEAKLSEFGLFRPKDIRLSTFVGTALAAGKAQLLDAARKVEDLRKQNIDLSRSKAEMMMNANAKLWKLHANIALLSQTYTLSPTTQALADRVARFIATGGREW